MTMEQNVLDEVYDYLGRFIAYPSEYARVADVAWIAHTYFMEAFEELGYATPRLLVLAPASRSGKSRLREITKLLVRNPVSMISPTSAAVYTLTGCSEEIPTLLIDEIGRMLERKDISEFLAIVEAGFQPGESVPRVAFDSEGKRRVENFNVYSPMLMAGIDNGRMPETITGRSVILRMKRNIGKRLSYRPRKHKAEGAALAGKLAEWSKTVFDKVQDIEPIMPDQLNDREQDKWEPLFIVGRLADVTAVTPVTDVTGNLGWLERIKDAALELSKEDKDTDTTSKSELLLKDIENISFDKISTFNLLVEINKIDESSWSTYNFGKPLDGGGLARLLKPYGIKPKTIRFDKDTDKGYYRSDFEDAFKRYLGVRSETPVTLVTEVTPVTDNTVAENDKRLYNTDSISLTRKEPYMPKSTKPTIPMSTADYLKSINAIPEAMYEDMCK
jgi:hypothetical protein